MKKFSLMLALVLFLLMGFYRFPYWPSGEVSLGEFKRALYLLALVAMVYQIRWREIRVDRFSLLMAIWVGVHGANWLIRGDHGADYLVRVVQGVFIFVLVQWFREGFDENSLASDVFLRNARAAVTAGVVVIAALAYDESFKTQLVDGFGNGRVSFSIWLAQLLFLSLLLSVRVDTFPALQAMIWVSPVLALQIFSGGRTGVLASLVLCLYFSYACGGWKYLLLTGAYLALLSVLLESISPVSGVYPGTSMFRDIGALPASQVFEPGGVMDMLDRLSSYRLGITVDAVAALDMQSLAFGKGVMNFQGAAIGEFWQVHNIYIRTLGELGVVGLGVMLGLLAPIFFFRGGGVILRLSGAFCFTYLMIGMLHPDLLLTAVSTCLIFWLAYAALLKHQLKSGEVRLMA